MPTARATAPRRTQAERRAQTESRLLDAAIELIAEGGVRAVTTAAVGERAGFSRGIVNHHFGSRDVLMSRLAEAVQARYTPRDTAARGVQRVAAIADDYLRNVRGRPDDTRVFLRLWAAATGGEEPSLADAFIERDRRFRSVFEAAIASGIEDGAIDPGIDPAALAAGLVGMVRGIAMQWQTSPDDVVIDRIRPQVTRLIDAGIAAEPGA